MSWYGKTAAKELDTLLQKKPTLTQLFLYPEFINELKAYNTKLLDYLTNNPSLFRQAIQYLTVPPVPNDNHDRKYKLPLMVVESIETETTCILNTFFKETGNNNQLYFDCLFSGIDSQQILPLLMGYLFRICFCLVTNRQKETIDRIYKSNKIFIKLIQHSNHMAATNILQLFLNLDLNKYQGVSSSEDRLRLKLEVLNKMINKIQYQFKNKSDKSSLIIENLCVVLCQTIQKYYLIIDGKQLMETITSEKTINVIMALIHSQNIQYAYPGFNFCISLINYYSFSSFNVDDITTEAGKKNLEKLETQPLISHLTQYFPTALDRVMRSSAINLYLYQLLEVLCHCISISSYQILENVRKTNFFGCLIKLLLVHEQNNILHKLIEKSFLHVFISDRMIYAEYKKHLLCELDIIDCTAGHIARLFPDEDMLEKAKKKQYFGHFMRILKIYSGIETKDQEIVNAIRAKSDLWNRISKLMIQPYESLCQKKLGSYEDVPEPAYQQFIINKQQDIKSKNISKTDNLKKSEDFAPTFMPKETPQKKGITDLFAVPTSTTQTQHPTIETQVNPILNNNLKIRQNSHMSQSNVIDYRTDDKEKQMKKSQSFKEFMSKKKVEAEKQIKLKRSLSQERRLSGSKTKMSSPSPSKKNSWKQEQPVATEKKRPIPKIPLNRKSLAQSSISQKKFKEEEIHDDRSSKSLVNMQELKKIKVYQIQKPVQKKYRRVQQKDRVLLQFLGLPL